MRGREQGHPVPFPGSHHGCVFRAFGTPRAPPTFQLLRISFGSSALRSCHLSAAIFTTTASADFCAVRPTQISPGKVRHLSARAAQLYHRRLSVTVGFWAP